MLFTENHTTAEKSFTLAGLRIPRSVSVISKTKERNPNFTKVFLLKIIYAESLLLISLHQCHLGKRQEAVRLDQRRHQAAVVDPVTVES